MAEITGIRVLIFSNPEYERMNGDKEKKEEGGGGERERERERNNS